MKSIAKIIREQLEEDAYVRRHEADILRFYVERAALARKKPVSVRAEPAVELAGQSELSL
ncbi:MAG: hypothetical protein DMG65_18295 [Candidatus Angelobacter sp. Gp1-AA117]|nr:MAG: hypothetical protein DMG65_18295 [Candidatus Angelobacter sp. Gp1-AA117]